VISNNILQKETSQRSLMQISSKKEF